MTTKPDTNAADSIEAKRLRAAEKFPEFLVDTLARKHPNVPRAAILSGAWDEGELVRNA